MAIDETLVRTDAADTVHFLADALGSTVALADPTAAVATEYTYEPFGRASVSGLPSSNPFQFTGRENDGTGIYYYRARYYSPSLARFIIEDPLGFAGGRNFYRYVQNNPTNLTDPSGLLMSGLILRGLAAALRTGATAEEIAVQARVADGLIGGVTAVTGPLLPPGLLETPIPGAGITVETALDISTAIGGVQTLSLAGTVAGLGGAGATGGVIVLGGAGGLAVGAAINGLVLNNPALFPGGNPVENLFCAVLFDCGPPAKGSFGRGR